jgi:YVTN family beta-propeller protein
VGTVERWGQRLVVVIATAIVAGALAASASAVSWRAMMVGDSTASNALIPIDVATDTAGSQIGAGNNPFGVVVSANGATAYVADYNTNNGGTDGITTVDLSQSPPTSSFIATDPSGGTFKPLEVALSPDGRTLWAVYPPNGRVEKIDLTGASPTAGAPFSDGTNDGADSIALSPDGRTAWVTDQPEGQVTPIDLTQDPPVPGTPIPVGRNGSFGTCDGASGSSSWPFGVAVSPDGSKVFVADIGTDQVSVIDTGSRRVTNVDLPAGGGAYQVAVAPDGQTVYVSQPCAHDVVPVSVSGTPSAGTPITVTFPDDAGGSPQGLAITPDGRHLYVGDGSGSGNQTVDVPLPSGTPQTAIDGGSVIRSGVVTPDQAPVANFSATSAAAGQPVSFDASSSRVAVGSITRYDWNFGDGSGVSTASPTVTHVYGAPGTYTASVTETDSAGTSTTVVYTGQSVARNGGPSAVASRAVVVASGAQPAVSQSATALSFGLGGVGVPSAPQSVTFSNGGAGALVISGSSFTGANPGDFSLSNDGCTGQTIAPGSSCSVVVTFNAGGAGPRSAALQFSDNASGSPHTIQLTGTGTTQATISGTVTDGSASGTPPVSGASVSVCTYSTRKVCKSVGTDSSGHYLVGVPPDTYQVEVFPPGGNLFGASSLVNAVAGQNTTDFTLQAGQGLPPGVTFNGQQGGGPPKSFWQSPSSLQVPVGVYSNGTPGMQGISVTDFWVSAQGAADGGPTSFGQLIVAYRYDSSGVPRFLGVRGYDGAPAGPGKAAIGTWATSLTTAPSTGGDVRGLVAQGVLSPPPGGPFYHGALRFTVTHYNLFKDAAGAARDHAANDALGLPPDDNPFVDPSVPYCPAGGCVTQPRPLPCVSKLTYEGQGLFVLPGGSYWDSKRRALFRANGTHVWFTTTNPLLSPTVVLSQPNATYGEAIWDPISHFVGDGRTANSSGEIPLDDLTVDPNGRFIEDGSPGPDAGRFQFNNDGSITDIQTGVTYGASGTPRASDRIGPHRPGRAGDGICPNPPPGNGNGGGSFDNYVDPSGTVMSTTGIPVAGAKVVLLRSARRHGRYRAVPRGSKIMSPGNRRNPDRTTSLGMFGWDVLTGFYRVSAQHPGCRAARGGALDAITRILRVPPPVVSLRLVLRCPHLVRRHTTTKLRVRADRGGDVILIARVRGRRPAGLVVFYRGRRRLGEVPVFGRRPVAALTVRGRSTRGFTVRYLGDGVNAPSQARG